MRSYRPDVLHVSWSTYDHQFLIINHQDPAPLKSMNNLKNPMISPLPTPYRSVPVFSKKGRRTSSVPKFGKVTIEDVCVTVRDNRGTVQC